MSQTSVGILILHAAILCFQLLARRVFPTQGKAIIGIYFVLMPVGFGLFMSPEPGMTLGLVSVGLIATPATLSLEANAWRQSDYVSA